MWAAGFAVVAIATAGMTYLWENRTDEKPAVVAVPTEESGSEEVAKRTLEDWTKVLENVSSNPRRGISPTDLIGLELSEKYESVFAADGVSEEVKAEALAQIIRDLATEEGATFQSSASLFRSFATRCRQQNVPSAHIDMLEFRRLFAFASAGLRDLQQPVRETIEGLADNVPDDVLAPYLAIAVAAAQGRPSPDEDEVARVYGSSSPSRIRRLLEHMEKQGLIVVREEFGGGRTISVVGLEHPANAIQAS